MHVLATLKIEAEIPNGAPDNLVRTFLSKGAWRTAFRRNLDLMERPR